MMGILLALNFSGYLLIKLTSQQPQKQIVGAIETVIVPEVGLSFRGRVDTGAKTTSINATDIKIENFSLNPPDNIGKSISFRIVNELDKSATIRTKIAKVRRIQNAESSEFRYYVYLTLLGQGIKKKVLVNLNDRSQTAYKILLGRNWLSQEFIVDIDKNSDD